MRKFVVPALFFLLTLACLSYAADFADIGEHPMCKYCGMDRAKFAHSRMLIEYDDGTSFGTCSLHCAAINLANTIDKTPRQIFVGDYNGRELLDAEKAYWVIGGTKAGVMTGNGKWAFADKSAADNFIKENGGTLTTFESAIKAAYEDMYKDTKQIRERRKMKRLLQQRGTM